MSLDIISQHSKDLTLSYLKKIHAKVKEIEGVFSVTIPTDYVRLFGERNARITFEQDIAATMGCELVVPGSNFLKVVIDETKKQAPVISGIITKKIENFQETIGKIPTHNCNISLKNSIEKEKLAARFYFIITLKSIKQVSMLKWIDLELEDLNILEFPAEIEIEDRRNEFNSDKTSIDNAYNKAIQSLEIELTPLKNKYVSLTEVNKQHNVDAVNTLYKKRIDELKQDLDYHRVRIREFDKKITNARYSHTMTKYSDEKIKAQQKLENEKEKAIKKIEKLAEDQRIELKAIQNRFRGHLEFSLIAAQLYTYNSSMVSLLLKNNYSGKTIEVEYIHPSSKFQTNCELCKNTMEVIHLCFNSHVACDRCTLHCIKCQMDICIKCQNELSTCYICKEGLCSKCSNTCNFCSEISCNNHSITCPHCTTNTCFFCYDTCKYCSTKFCNKSLVKCHRCHNKICINDIENCVQCKLSFCPVDRSTCSICKEFYCSSDSAQCRICDQMYSINCVSKKTCSTCQNFNTIDIENSLVQDLLLKDKSFKKYKKWELSQNSKYDIFRAKKFLSTKIIVIEKNTGNIILLKKGGWRN